MGFADCCSPADLPEGGEDSKKRETIGREEEKKKKMVAPLFGFCFPKWQGGG